MKTIFLETDQTLCFNEEGLSVPCENSGQDAANIKVISWKNRFQVQGDLVLDTFTGALWTKNTNPAEFPLSFEEAKSLVTEMSEQKAHGYKNWQLPPRRLLFSLLSHEKINPSLPENHPFENVFPGYYWSQDTCHRLPDQAWYVHLGGARVPKGMKDGAALAWPVVVPSTQKTEIQDNNRFIIKDGLAYDSFTGLSWNSDTNLAGKAVSWEEALSLVKEMNKSSENDFCDWRLPNIRELESLVDLEQDSPALAESHPFKNVMEGYWSSTTSLYEPRYSWVLYMRDGLVGVGFKKDKSFYAWPVRGLSNFHL